MAGPELAATVCAYRIPFAHGARRSVNVRINGAARTAIQLCKISKRDGTNGAGVDVSRVQLFTSN